jgi:hypothetical protein
MKEKDRYQYLPATSRGALGLELDRSVTSFTFPVPHGDHMHCYSYTNERHADFDDRHCTGMRGGG